MSALIPSALAPAWGAAALHAGVALACAWAAQAARPPQVAWRAGPQSAGAAVASTALWRAASALLLVLALNALLHADRLLVLALRDAARAGGWYAWRRPLQGAALAALFLVTLLAWLRGRRLHEAAVASRHADGSRRRHAARPGQVLGWGGLSLLLALAAVRLVSLHHTDLVLDHRLLGLSVGRWIEATGLLALAAGAVRAATTAPDLPARAWRREASPERSSHV